MGGKGGGELMTPSGEFSTCQQEQEEPLFILLVGRKVPPILPL
jgi:hypothetical protein